MITFDKTWVHPIMVDELHRLYGWDNWMDAWRGETKPPSFEVRHGLLHRGFDLMDMSREKTAEQLRFYFRCADGHNWLSHFERELPPDEIRAPQEAQIARLRRQLSQKAFEVLASHLPTKQATFGHESFDYAMLFGESLIDQMVWFLRLDGRRRSLFNLHHPKVSKNHYNDLGIEFAKALTLFLFSDLFLRICPPAFRERAVGLRQDLLPTMIAMKNLHFLLSDGYNIDYYTKVRLVALVQGSELILDRKTLWDATDMENINAKADQGDHAANFLLRQKLRDDRSS